MITGLEMRQFIQREQRAIVEADYALMRRVPSTTTWRIVDYFRTLDVAERDVLLDEHLRGQRYELYPKCKASEYKSTRPAGQESEAYARFLAALRESVPLGLGVKIRHMLYDRPFRQPFVKRELAKAGIPEESRKETNLYDPATASQIRRAIKTAFVEKYSATAKNNGGGEWAYTGSFQGRDFLAHIDYGGSNDQLCYDLWFEYPDFGLRACALSYESMLGFGNGSWDFLTATNVGESVDLLCEFIEKLVTIPERIRG